MRQQRLIDYKIAAGKLVDKLLDMYNSHLVEKISFPDGLRYTVRLYSPDNRPLDLHIVNKFDKLFIELWLPNYASPLLVLEKSAEEDVDNIVHEISTIISILWHSGKRKRRRKVRQLA